jgi:hypothetical protein
VSTYRTGNHWGVTIVRSGSEPIEMGKRPDGELVAVVVNGDVALAERICALLNGDDRCWHGEHCPGSGPDCERDAPLKGGHRDCADAWHAEHGCCTEPYDLNPTGTRVTRCICNNPPPTVDKPKNGTASRPPGWSCPKHGVVL